MPERRVIIVERDDAIRQAMRDALEDEGYSVTGVSPKEFEQNARFLSASRRGLIFYDVVDKRDVEEVERLDATYSARGHVFVAMSTNVERVGIGGRLHLSKPFELDQFLALTAELHPLRRGTMVRVSARRTVSGPDLPS